jgi:hypothetical protein
LDACLQIRDLHIAKEVEDIGFYAGFIGEFSPKRCFFYDLLEHLNVFVKDVVL